MPQQLKGNPASKRMSNADLKAKRARSWLRGQRRNEERKVERLRVEKRNAEDRRVGRPTPWERAKYVRWLNRHPGGRA